MSGGSSLPLTDYGITELETALCRRVINLSRLEQREQLRHPELMQEIQRTTQRVVIEHLRCDSSANQPLDRLVPEEPRSEVKTAIRETQPVQQHRLHSLPHCY